MGRSGAPRSCAMPTWRAGAGRRGTGALEDAAFTRGRTPGIAQRGSSRPCVRRRNSRCPLTRLERLERLERLRVLTICAPCVSNTGQGSGSYADDGPGEHAHMATASAQRRGRHSGASATRRCGRRTAVRARHGGADGIAVRTAQRASATWRCGRHSVQARHVVSTAVRWEHRACAGALGQWGDGRSLVHPPGPGPASPPRHVRSRARLRPPVRRSSAHELFAAPLHQSAVRHGLPRARTTRRVGAPVPARGDGDGNSGRATVRCQDGPLGARHHRHTAPHVIARAATRAERLSRP